MSDSSLHAAFLSFHLSRVTVFHSRGVLCSLVISPHLLPSAVLPSPLLSSSPSPTPLRCIRLILPNMFSIMFSDGRFLDSFALFFPPSFLASLFFYCLLTCFHPSSHAPSLPACHFLPPLLPSYRFSSPSLSPSSFFSIPLQYFRLPATLTFAFDPALSHFCFL